MKIKRFLAMLLVVVMAMVALASCAEASCAELIADADKALAGGRYKATAKVNIDCKNETYGETINQLFAAALGDMDFYIDGDNFATDMSIDMPGFSVSMSISAVDNVVYYSMGEIKVKASADKEQLKELMGEINSTEEMLDTDDFVDLSKVEKDGKVYITCTSYNNEKINELLDEAEDMYGALNATNIAIDNIKLVATLKDGKYEDITMSMLYSFNVDSEAIEVEMSVSMLYDYEAGKEITVPADASSYKDVSFDELGFGD